MKENIFLVSYDYELTKKIAEKLADSFSMRVFDQKELFEFDNLPRTFGEVCESLGNEYILKGFRSIVKMELDFKNAVFVSDMSIADNCYDLFYKIKLNNFVVLLYEDTQTELKELELKRYASPAEAKFFKSNKEILKERKEIIEKDCADISVDIANLSIDEITQKVISHMKMFYET